jgi:hypothetical protein
VNEKRYLCDILKVVESKKRLRRVFYYQVIWVLLSLAILYCAAHFGLTSRSTAVLLIGFVCGIFIAKVEAIYNFRYLISHLSAQSIKARLSDIEA